MNSSKRILLSVLLLLLSVSLFGAIKPDWVKGKFENQSQYYIGVGSAKAQQSGDNEYQMALERARMNLAASISVEIVSEVEVSSDSVTGNTPGLKDSLTERYTENIKQYVSNNIKEIEVVDTWHHYREGTFVYVRLSKAKYQAYRNREKTQILNRVTALLRSAQQSSFSKHIEILMDSWELVANSGYQDEIRYNDGILDYNLQDYLELQTIDLLEGLRIVQEGTNGMQWQTNQPLPLSFRLEYDGDFEKTKIGSCDLKFINPITNETMGTVSTNSQGKIDAGIELQAKKAPLGKNSFICELSLGDREERLSQFKKQVNLPQKRFSVVVVYSQMGVLVEGAVNAGVLKNSIMDVLRKKGLSIEFVNNPNCSSQLVLNVHYEVKPIMFEGQPIIVMVQANLICRERGNTVFSYDLPAVRGVGLDAVSAKKNGNTELMKAFESDSEFVSAFSDVF